MSLGFALNLARESFCRIRPIIKASCFHILPHQFSSMAPKRAASSSKRKAAESDNDDRAASSSKKAKVTEDASTGLAPNGQPTNKV